MSPFLTGTGVITGSPPNLVVPQVMENRFGDNTGLTFASWMAFAVPVMLVNLIISWAWISFIGELIFWFDISPLGGVQKLRGQNFGFFDPLSPGEQFYLLFPRQ